MEIGPHAGRGQMAFTEGSAVHQRAESMDARANPNAAQRDLMVAQSILEDLKHAVADALRAGRTK